MQSIMEIVEAINGLHERLRAVEGVVDMYRSHKHGQYEIGLTSMQVVEPVSGYQGLAIKTIAHVAINAGELVCWLQGASGADNQVDLTPITGNSQDMPIGSAYNSAAAGGALLVIVAGYALLTPTAAVTATRGYVAYASSTTAGMVDQAASGATAQHWRECGHFCADGSGAGKSTLATLHFN